MKMKLAAVALLFAATPAHAEPAKVEATPAATAPTGPAATGAQPFSRETTLEVLMANPAAKTATLTVFPDLDNHPAWDMIIPGQKRRVAHAPLNADNR